jgi:DUF2075 family protein
LIIGEKSILDRAYYSASISKFLDTSNDEILGILAKTNEFSLEQTQRIAWQQQIEFLKNALKPYSGKVYFEYSIPRMGQRIDTLLVIENTIFVLEFKIGDKEFTSYAIDQVWDYALDLKNFHETSHNTYIAPILIATKAKLMDIELIETLQNDKMLHPIKCNQDNLSLAISKVLEYSDGARINIDEWENGRYCPTPTIVEAAMVLYNNHSVEEISRSDASAINLKDTSQAIAKIISESREKGYKSLCFVTGVPGAGKTLVGLNIATTHFDKENDLYSVFLSGNGPLVIVLREALTRDKYKQEKLMGSKKKKSEVMSEVKMFIQNVHNFRDECLKDIDRPPIEHVALFDEAQRAWTLEQTTNFMSRKKGIANFQISEPEFLISCLNRHIDWAVIVCLVGGGQEINTGEAGIGEWIDALIKSYPDWHVYISPNLSDSEYAAGKALEEIKSLRYVDYSPELHLSVSMRSFRAEKVSLLIKQLLDINVQEAQQTLKDISEKYPIVITRDLVKAKKWLKDHARGSERYGMVVSSQAERLKPHAIYVKSPVNPVHWFLNDKDDVRSSYYLEDVATEFMIQGLELDWVCVTWDADFRCKNGCWDHWSFVGDKWQRINKAERQIYLKNAYRVLLTRARQGMVIVVPKGDAEDHTRKPEYYDPIYEYLVGIGFDVLD